MEDLKSVLVQIQKLEQEKKIAQAIDLASNATHKFGQQRQLGLTLARLLMRAKEFSRALPILKGVHEAIQAGGEKTEISVLIDLARCQYRSAHYENAKKLYQQLNQVMPDNPDILSGLGACSRHAGELEVAEKLLSRAVKLAADHKVSNYEMAQLHVANKRIDDAIALLEKNIRRTDVDGDSIDLWLLTLDQNNRNRYAQDVLEDLSRRYPEVLEFVYGFGVLANRAGEITLARPAFQKSLELSPNNHRIIYELGIMERIAGNLERSQQLINRALELHPDNPAALRTHGSEIRYEYGDENFKRLNYVAAKFSEFQPIEQIHLHYALAKASEDVGELDAAFRHYSVAGAKKRKTDKFNEREAERLHRVIPQVVTRAKLAQANEKGSDSDVPVFILGMPRSGTSLMEQILSSHPDVFGAGELKFMTGVLENIGIGENKGLRLRMGEKDPVFEYDRNAPWAERGQRYVEKLEKLADKPYKRIVDKMPGNFNFVGLIHAVLPNAKIIHSRRHPVETCLSCYRIHFAEGHQWTYNLRELGRYYKRYWDLMKYWREEFPGVMYEAVYEENVADVETSARNLIAHLELPWNDRCLEFYNTDRPVKTASVTQVRKPIYKTSTNRWRKYEKYLGPLLDELGDIVPQYEAEIAHLIEK